MLAGLTGFGLGAPVPDAGPRGVLRIGTGNVTGLYYALGSGLARIVRDADESGELSISVFGSSGSLNNLLGLRNGLFDLAVVQADSALASSPRSDLRLLFAAMPETCAILLPPGSTVTQVSDLRRRRVDLGAPGSGNRALLEELLRVSGLSVGDLAAAVDLPAAERDTGLCRRRVDALALITGHPTIAVREVIDGCGADFLPLDEATIAEICRRRPALRPMSIPGGRYPGQQRTVPTFGARALVLASPRLPEASAYRLVRTVVDRLGELRRLHLAFAELEPAALAGGDLGSCSQLPFHLGAARLFRERKLFPNACAAA